MQPTPRPPRRTARDALSLAAALVLCQAAGGLGAALTTPHLQPWYALLNKPAWTPPNAVFGPVWSALFLLMGVAAWQVWRQAGWPRAAPALALFALQLVLNVGWSALFFALRSPGAALLEVAVLWLAIAATLRAFWRHSRAAGWLLAPYLAWVSFAAALNLAIWRLNM